MALQAGFPPVNTIGPGVFIVEQDNSLTTPQQSFHRAGLIGFASKGPINTPQLITSQRQLTTTFGYPHPESGDPYLIYAAQQYLLVGTELWVVRVAETDTVNDEQAVTAAVAVPSAGGAVQIISATPGPYTFTVDSFFRWRLNGILSQRSLVAFSGTYTATQLAATLNNQLNTAIDGFQFYVSATNTIAVETTFSFGPNASFELVSIQDAIYGGPVVGGVDTTATNVTGLGTGMTRASTTGSLAQYPASYQTAGNYNFAGLTNLNLQIVIDGSDNANIDNKVQVIDLASLQGTNNTLTQVINTINAQKVENGGTLPGGWTAYAVGNNLAFRTDHFGEDARLLIKSDSTASALFGFSNLTVSGTSPSGTTGDAAITTYGIVDGNSNTTGALTFTVTADSAGIDGNSTQVVIANNVREGNFSMQVFNNGVQVESWGNLTKDPTSTYYVATYLSLVSDWIRVIDNTGNTSPPLDGTYSLTGGTDGIPANPDDQDAMVIGNQIGYTGMYALSEPEQIDIDLIAIPGHSSTSVVLALLSLCQTVRGDCLAIVDPPFGLTVSEIVAWQNGTHPLNNTRFDSDFGALYWPWVKIRDNFNRIDIWAPPSGSVMATIARSDALSAPWYAPAGINRGVVPNINDVFSRPTAEERNLMEGYRNCVNPIVQFVDFDGFVIWGQKTLQRLPTALDRINVRRLMFYIEKQISSAARQLLFDPHDDELEQKFVRIASGILSDVQVGRGIYDYLVICDSTLNTPDVVNLNELRAQVAVQPVKDAEYIFIEFSIHNKGDFTSSSAF